MKKAEPSFDEIPASAISETTLIICLKCAFELFTKQLQLPLRTSYIELKKHVPEETDFSGASTTRPHFFEPDENNHCPYCGGSKRWFAEFRAIRIDEHPSFEKQRKKLWAALKKYPERYTLWHPDRTQMQIFSEWLERLNRHTDIEEEGWLLKVALEFIKRVAPSTELDQALSSGVRRVQLSRQLEGDWHYENFRLFVPPGLYGDTLMVQHLLSRSHLHGGKTFEGRLTLQELMGRLRRIGYMEAREIDTRDSYEAFEQAIAKIVDSGPSAEYYADDRSDYHEQLKTDYDKKRKTK